MNLLSAVCRATGHKKNISRYCPFIVKKTSSVLRPLFDLPDGDICLGLVGDEVEVADDKGHQIGGHLLRLLELCPNLEYKKEMKRKSSSIQDPVTLASGADCECGVRINMTLQYNRRGHFIRVLYGLASRLTPKSLVTLKRFKYDMAGPVLTGYQKSHPITDNVNGLVGVI
jgi:hypothetical protein